MPRTIIRIHNRALKNHSRRPYGIRNLTRGLAALPFALTLGGAVVASSANAQATIGGTGGGTTLPIPTGEGTPLPAPSPGHTQVLTYHNDNQRTGVNPYEAILTPAVVKKGFGKLFSHVVDGTIYGQPLFVSDLPVTNVYSSTTVTHKGVLFVTTANNSIYAFDADSASGANGGPLWHVSFNYTQGNIGPVPGNSIVDLFGNPQQDIQPVIGIIGTPVIDPTTSTLFVLVRTQEFNDFVQRLHAIDITTGLERVNSPVDVYSDLSGTAPSVPGDGDGTDGNGNVIFDPLFENQRAALLVSNGTVYISWGGTDNIAPYHGWILGYDTSTYKLKEIFNTTPNATYSYNPGDPPVGGGIDMSGSGPAADAKGNIFLATGLGQFDANSTDPTTSDQEYGESILHLTATKTGLTVADYFTPYNYSNLNAIGNDLGTGGVVLLPDSAGVPKHPHLLVAGGMEGKIYLLDRDNLGKVGEHDDTGAVYYRRNSIGPAYGAPAVFNNRIYYHGTGDVLRAFQINQTFPYLTDLTPQTTTSPVYEWPGAVPSVSSNQTANGVVWDVEPYYAPIPNPIIGGPQTLPPVAVLHAYDATTGQQIWSGNTAGGRDTGNAYVKFTVPTVANGKVTVAGDGGYTVYGPVTNPTTVSGLNYVISGPTFIGGWASSGNFPIYSAPTLVPNIKYDFSVTAVGTDGKPMVLNNTAIVYLQPLGSTTKLPVTSITFNNSSNATFTTFVPYAESLFNLTVADNNGNISTAAIQTSVQSTFGFDHYVIRAPKTVRSGQLTTVLLTAEDINYLPVPLPDIDPLIPGDLLAVYDTLPSGTQPYNCNPGNEGSWGVLPDDNAGFFGALTPAATSTVGFPYEFQWGFGNFTTLGVNSPYPGVFTGYTTTAGLLAAGIPVRLYGAGKHIIVITDFANPGATAGLVEYGLFGLPGGYTATAIVNVIP